ncbi:MAG: hypothetical protein WCC12_16930 [Anaerolineales bacterium]
MNKSAKISYFLFMLLVVLGAYIGIFHENELRSIFGYPKVFVEIENGNSALLKLLLQQQDFSNSYHWYNLVTDQTDYLPRVENNYLEEGSFTWFVGYYNRRWVRVTEFVKRYETPETASNEMAVPLLQHKSVDMLLDVNLIKAAKLQRSQCARLAEQVAFCSVVIRNSAIVIRLDLELEPYIDSHVVEEILNPLLEILEKRMGS